MLTLPDEINEELSPEYSKSDIQAIKEEYEDEQKISDLEVMMEDKPDDEPDEFIALVVKHLNDEHPDVAACWRPAPWPHFSSGGVWGERGPPATREGHRPEDAHRLHPAAWLRGHPRPGLQAPADLPAASQWPGGGRVGGRDQLSILLTN